MAVLLGALALSAATPSGPGVAASSQAATVLRDLAGDWRGTGVLMGRAAEFRMRWCPTLEGRFVRLQFANAFAPEDGDGEAVPVLAATAHYRAEPEESGRIPGVWVDTRGLILPLSARATATELVTEWGDEATERGRTTYRVQGPESVEVRDEVLRGGEYALFGEASYARVAGAEEACAGEETDAARQGG